MPVSPPTYKPSWISTKQANDRFYNKKRRNKDSVKFYHSAAWEGCRQIKLSANPYCELCLLGGVHTPATHVHHRQEITTHPHLALDIDNMQSLCLPCHSRVHAIQ